MREETGSLMWLKIFLVRKNHVSKISDTPITTKVEWNSL